MKNFILHRNVSLFITAFLLMTLYSVSFTSIRPARRSNNNSAKNIKIELSSDPKHSLPISAATNFPIYSNNSLAFITVKVTENGIESSDLRKDITLNILGLQQGQGYVPIGMGYLHPLDNWPDDKRWAYGAFKEPTTEKHPQLKSVVIGAKYKGKIVGEPIKIDVRPIFQWLTGVHQHGPSESAHSPTDNDYNNAWQYVKWKYGIDTGYLDSIQYDKTLLGKAGLTKIHIHANPYSVTYDTLLGLTAFNTENVCASTLGHENVHGNQPPPWKTGPAEVEAYQWEIDHAGMTGLSMDEKQDAINCRDYFAGVSGASCAG